jgi:hypothetical protein
MHEFHERILQYRIIPGGARNRADMRSVPREYPEARPPSPIQVRMRITRNWSSN